MENGCAIFQNVLFASDLPVICPKPRRLFAAASSRTIVQSAELSDPKSANELLNILLPMGSDETIDQSDLPPPFFCGSPPTRSSNPVVHDARFGEAVPPHPVAIAPAAGSARSDGGRVRYDLVPATIRVEGFDCLDRGRRRNRDISAVA